MKKVFLLCLTIIGLLIIPRTANAIEILTGPLVEITETHLPDLDISIAQVGVEYGVLLSNYPKGYCYPNGFSLTNESDQKHTIELAGKQISLGPNQTYYWRIDPSCYETPQEASQTASLMEAIGKSEIVYRETPWELRGQINNQLFSIQGVIISKKLPTYTEASIQKTFQKTFPFGGFGIYIVVLLWLIYTLHPKQRKTHSLSFAFGLFEWYVYAMIIVFVFLSGWQAPSSDTLQFLGRVFLLLIYFTGLILALGWLLAGISQRLGFPKQKLPNISLKSGFIRLAILFFSYKLSVILTSFY